MFFLLPISNIRRRCLFFWHEGSPPLQGKGRKESGQNKQQVKFRRVNLIYKNTTPSYSTENNKKTVCAICDRKMTESYQLPACVACS